MSATPNILVAGVGNIFLGDDAFGVEVVQRLSQRPQPAGVRLTDFGIRSFDLAYALMDGYDATLLIDALPHGQAPGTLYLLEPDLRALADAPPAAVEGHSMDPVKVLQLVQALGGQPRRLLVLGCEPGSFGPADQGQMGLSEPLQAALEPAVAMAERIIGQLCQEVETHGPQT
jgi:hydrogenase maturation protease